VHTSQQERGLGKEIVSRLVRLSAGHKKIILCSPAGPGFRRMTTAMAIFEDPDKAFAVGYLRDL